MSFFKYNISGNNLRHLQRVLILLAILLPQISVFGQSNSEKNKVVVIGRVSNNQNGAPLKNHEVLIVTDSTYKPQGLNYTNKLMTDHEGYYYDTIVTEDMHGAFIVSTLDFAGSVHDTTVYFRFNWSDHTIVFANFSLPVPQQPSQHQANFYFQSNPNGISNLEYAFFDASSGGDIISWHWNFGDETYSTEQNPVHAYEEGGLYRIILTVLMNVETAHNPVVSQMVKVINVTAKNYYHMGGHVMAGSFPIDIGQVFLYKIGEKELEPIDTATFNDTLGYYYFFQLIEGDYIIKADMHPESNLFNDFLATYFSDKIHWSEADTVHHHSTQWEYNINLVPNPQQTSGPGTIGGIIEYGEDDPNGKSGMPAFNQEIILFDEDFHPMDITHSDEAGTFSLDLLNLQTYYLYAEVTGKFSFPLLIELNEINSSITFVKLVIGEYGVNGSVSSGINDIQSFEFISPVYPNPASDLLNLDIQLNQAIDFDINIMSMEGKLVSSTQVNGNSGSNSFSINISGIDAGFYYMILQSNNKPVAIQKFIVQ